MITPKQVVAIVDMFGATLKGIIIANDEQGLRDLVEALAEVSQRALVRIEAKR